MVSKFGEGGDLLKCSFCGKSQKQVKKLIAGPGVYICDECIDLCNEIIEEELAEASDIGLEELPKPREIYEFLELPYDDRLEAALAARIKEEPTAQLGEHDYDIADYGLTEAQIENAFSDYRRRFRV